MLATVADVETRVGEDLTSVAGPIEELLTAAQGHIEREAGRPLEQGSHAEVFDGGHRLILLTNWPVAAITDVVEDGVTLTADDYVWYDDGRLIRVAAGNPIRWRPARRQVVDVTYVAGYDPVPADLVDLCAQMVARAWTALTDLADRPATAAGGVKRIRLENREEEYFPLPTGPESARHGVHLTDVEAAWVRAAYGRDTLV